MPPGESGPQRQNPSKIPEGAPKTRLTKDFSGKWIYGGVGAIVLYAMFNVVFEQREPSQVVAGWDGISNCSFMVSLDGKRRLSLSENHFARIEEPDRTSTEGLWSFDQSTGKYTVTIHDESIIYSAVAPGDGDGCMLIRGDLATADLLRSWFYSRADLDDQSDDEPPER
jgi:hypothetical protein